MQNWYAPSLTANARSGLGSWSEEDIAALLKGGASMRGSVYGPMAEVTHNSLQYLSHEDASAMAAYLKSMLQLKPVAVRQTDSAAPAAPVIARRQAVYAHLLCRMPPD